MEKEKVFVNFPLSKSTMAAYAQAIFTPVGRGQCCTVIFQPEAGKRKRSKFLVENLNLFKSSLPKDKPVEAYYIDPVDLIRRDSPAYLLLILQTLQSEEKEIPDERLLIQKLKQLFLSKTRKCHLVLFLGKFDEIEFMPGQLAQNLKALWQVDKTSVHFIFLAKREIVLTDEVKKYGELSEAIMQNIYHVPALVDEDVDHIISSTQKKFGARFKPVLKSAIAELGQRHPYLIKIASEIAAQSPGDILDQRLKDIVKMDAQYEFVVRLIRGENPELSISGEKDVIFFGDRPFGSHLTAKEYALLSHFLKNKGVIVTRDEIAEVLWGKNSYEKYSDWAIDQMMSTLRKKLQKAGLGKGLETLKGKGYRFV